MDKINNPENSSKRHSDSIRQLVIFSREGGEEGLKQLEELFREISASEIDENYALPGNADESQTRIYVHRDDNSTAPDVALKNASISPHVENPGNNPGIKYLAFVDMVEKTCQDRAIHP